MIALRANIDAAFLTLQLVSLPLRRQRRDVNPAAPDGREAGGSLKPHRGGGVKQILAHPNDVPKPELTPDRGGAFLPNIRA